MKADLQPCEQKSSSNLLLFIVISINERYSCIEIWVTPITPVPLNFWSILSTFILGLLGMGQLHEYLVSGNAPANYEEAPRVLRSIIEIHDIANARRLVEAASYANAAGQYAVIPGNVKKTVARLTGRIEKDRFDESPVEVKVDGLTDSECLRAARFLTFKGDNLALRDEPAPASAPTTLKSGSVRNQLKNRVAVSRPLGTNTGFGI